MIVVRSEQKLKDHETTSENLKKRASFLSLASCTPTEADLWLWVCLSVRFSIRDLDKDFHQSEEDIKALQSVGQIIGEVLKKLDDERCAYHPFPLLFPLPSPLLLLLLLLWNGAIGRTGADLTPVHSHRQGQLRTALCRLLPTAIARREGAFRHALVFPKGLLTLCARVSSAPPNHSSLTRHDDPHHHADPAARGRPSRLLHVARGPRRSFVRRYRRFGRAGARVEGGDRASSAQPGTVHSGRHQGAQGSLALRTSWNGKDSSGASDSRDDEHQLPQGRLFGSEFHPPSLLSNRQTADQA